MGRRTGTDMPNLGRNELLIELRALKPDLEKQGITRVSLFGSRARADNRPDSDIDLIIEVEPDQKFSLLDIVGVGQSIEDRLGLPANIFMRRSLTPDFLSSMRSDLVTVF
ncbi:nucleotidyltransferase domain-containing protein [Devosia sp.]|uniref:nucleotidyltransferase family protein n=1 Tax=Devosia sp. TaxID=1871048 RepID=UPI003266DB77